VNRVKRRKREFVCSRIVYRDKEVAGLDGICDEGCRAHLPAARRDAHSLIGGNAESFRVDRIYLHINLAGIKLSQDSGFSSTCLRVPL
jgi:hypothetical protein